MVDQSTVDRQQRLYKRLLDAGMTLEQDDRQDDTKREAKAGSNDDPFAPQGAAAAGKEGARFRPPTWEELRGLSAEERRTQPIAPARVGLPHRRWGGPICQARLAW